MNKFNLLCSELEKAQKLKKEINLGRKLADGTIECSVLPYLEDCVRHKDGLIELICQNTIEKIKNIKDINVWTDGIFKGITIMHTDGSETYLDFVM